MTAALERVSYFSPEAQVSVLVPASWDGAVIDESTFRVFGPPHPEFDDYRSTMSWSRQTAPNHGGDWIEALAVATLADSPTDYAQFRLIRERRLITSDLAPMYSRWFSWADPESALEFTQIQALLGGDSLWVINAATLTSLAPTYLQEFESMLDSTRIIPAG